MTLRSSSSELNTTINRSGPSAWYRSLSSVLSSRRSFGRRIKISSLLAFPLPLNRLRLMSDRSNGAPFISFFSSNSCTSDLALDFLVATESVLLSQLLNAAWAADSVNHFGFTSKLSRFGVTLWWDDDIAFGLGDIGSLTCRNLPAAGIVRVCRLWSRKLVWNSAWPCRVSISRNILK